MQFFIEIMDVYIFDIFANFGPKFSGNIHDISNTENKNFFLFIFFAYFGISSYLKC